MAMRIYTPTYYPERLSCNAAYVIVDTAPHRKAGAKPDSELPAALGRFLCVPAFPKG